MKAVLGTTRPKRVKPAPVKLKETKAEVAAKTKREPSEDDLYSHLMYPQVFADFAKFQRDFSDVSVLPTPAFFYGLQPGEEISVSIEEGKVLFIKLINIGAPDNEGRRVISVTSSTACRARRPSLDKSIAPKAKPRVKADAERPAPGRSADPGHGHAAECHRRQQGSKSGDKLATLEAMKMQTTVYAHGDGVIGEVLVKVGDSVDAGDLLVRLRT